MILTAAAHRQTTSSVLKQVTIFTDGSCEGNPGPGGWAAILSSGVHHKEISGGSPATTNNRMELLAAIEALAALKEPCHVELWTDSQYLRDGIDRWVAGWKRNGWRTREKKPVKNEDLWRRLDALCVRHQIVWRWVKGHAGHAQNERCDELARRQVVGIRQTHTTAQLEGMLTRFKTEQAGASIPTRA